MSITNGYATVANVQAADASVNALGTAATATLERIIESASRAIDDYTDRVFFVAGSATARVYSAPESGVLTVDDVATSTGLTVATSTNLDGTYDVSWASSDFQAEPLNQIVSGRYSPITRLRAVGDYAFPVSARAGVQVTARWGYATTVPTQVAQACIQLSLRFFARFGSPTGVQSSNDFGAVYVSRKLDPDVAMMLNRLCRTPVASA